MTTANVNLFCTFLLSYFSVSVLLSYSYARYCSNALRGSDFLPHLVFNVTGNITYLLARLLEVKTHVLNTNHALRILLL